MTRIARTSAVALFVLVQMTVVHDLTGHARQTGQHHAGFHVSGVPGGGVSCGEMAINLGADRQSWGMFYTSYVNGFITGANFVSYVANGRKPDVGSDVPPEQIFASVEQYCRQNRSKNIHEAVESVYTQLAAR